jgi:predicted HD phosphohydrolase
MATQNGIDDHHEARGAGLLRQVFANAAIWQPVALHVQAKRWLVSAEPAYAAMLSEESHRSLALQGGTMNAAEAQAFLLKPHAQDAIALRRWDDLAKDPQAAPPPLSYWRQRLITA